MRNDKRAGEGRDSFHYYYSIILEKREMILMPRLLFDLKNSIRAVPF